MDILLKFFVYSVLGCGIEVLWCILIHKQIRSRRMLLKLPMCPVYGIGGVLMSLFLSEFRDNYILLWSFGALLASAVELLYFLIFRQVFKILAWDYRHKKANIMGGVCGGYTLLWGAVSVVFVRYVDPFVTWWLDMQSEYGKLVATVFLSLTVLVDVRNTATLLTAFGEGSADKLPECFWYMKRSSS